MPGTNTSPTSRRSGQLGIFLVHSYLSLRHATACTSRTRHRKVAPYPSFHATHPLIVIALLPPYRQQTQTERKKVSQQNDRPPPPPHERSRRAQHLAQPAFPRSPHLRQQPLRMALHSGRPTRALRLRGRHLPRPHRAPGDLPAPTTELPVSNPVGPLRSQPRDLPEYLGTS